MHRTAILLSVVLVSAHGGPVLAQGTIQPDIRGPVHAGAGAVFVENLQIGSEVDLFSYVNDETARTLIGSDDNASGRARFETPPTDPARALVPDRTLVACASHAGDEPVCSDPVDVRPAPTRLLQAPIYAGGSVLYQGAACAGALPDGLLPGSTVMLRDASDPANPAPYEDAAEVRPGLAPILALQDPFWPRSQHGLRIVGRLGGRDITRQASLPQPSRYDYSTGCERRVDPPDYARLPQACRRDLHLDSLVPGGQFGVTAGGDVVFGPEFCAVRTDGSFLLGRPLDGATTLKAQQQLIRLQLPGCGQREAAVAPPGLPDFRVHAIAPESNLISVDDLVRGATLEVRVTDAAGQTYSYADIPVAAHDLDPFTFGIGRDFQPGDRVLIRETLGDVPECDLSKEVGVPVAERPNGLPPLRIVTPVYACTSDVEVERRLDGAMAAIAGTGQIISTAGETDFPLGRDTGDTVGLDYVLEEGWQLTAVQFFGSQTSPVSAPPVPVLAAPDMDPPLRQLRGLGVRDLFFDETEYLLDVCQPAVHVLDGVRGAHVDILRTERMLTGGARQPAFRQLAQGKLADPSTTAIPVPASALSVGDILVAKQTLCGRSSEGTLGALRAGHQVFVEDPGRLREIDLTRYRQVDIDLSLGCKAAEPVTIAVQSTNTDVMVVSAPTVTVNAGSDTARLRVSFLKAGRARLSAGGEFVVARPGAGGLGPSELVELRAFDWAEQTPVTIALEEHPLPAGVISNEPFSTQAWTGQIDPGDPAFAQTFDDFLKTRVTRVVNAGPGNCALRLLDELYREPENRCLGNPSWIDYLGTREGGLSYEFDMTGIPEADRGVDRRWWACTSGGYCAEPDVRLELHYEALTDVAGN